MAQYIYYPTVHFKVRLERIKQRDPSGHIRIKEVINRLLDFPDDADGRMVGIHHGKYKKYVGRSAYRLIYYFCELCRKKNRELAVRCEQCDSIKDNSVVFFEVYHKNESKKLKDSDL